jgi:uncharacterized membrane protein YgcG
VLYSPEYHHREAYISRLKTKLTFAFGLFSLTWVGSTYALGMITLVFVAVGGIALWCGREYLRSQVRREANERKLLSEFTEYEAAFISASPERSNDPMMIVCSWDEVAESNSLVRLVLMKRSDDDFVLVGIGFGGVVGGTKLVVEAVRLDVDTAVRLFATSQKDKAVIQGRDDYRSTDSRTSGGGGGSSVGEGGVGGDGGGCGGDGGCGGGGGD